MDSKRNIANAWNRKTEISETVKINVTEITTGKTTFRNCIKMKSKKENT